VYKATKKSDKLDYAVKIFQTGGNLPEKYLTVEQKAHHTLNNPKENIIQFYEEFTLNKEYKCLVLELADDCLDNFLKLKYPNGMPEKVAFFFFEQIYKGVKFIHSNRIIHRDLKAANILLKDFKVKICDFNVCRFIDENLENPNTLTRVGTYDYLAPEFAKDTDISKDNWQKVDVYSLGILLYVMLYGKQPYKYDQNFSVGNNMIKAIDKINYENGNGTISPEAADFIKKCLNPKIETRISINDVKNEKWFKKVGGEFSAIVKNKKVTNHKELLNEILKTI